MKTFPLAIFALSLALPVEAQVQTTGRMTEEQLIQRMNVRNICKGRSVVSVRYLNDTDNRVSVICGDAKNFVSPTDDLSGSNEASLLVGLVVGLGFMAITAGSSGSTSDTQ